VGYFLKIFFKNKKSEIGTGSKGQKKADMDFIPYRLFYCTTIFGGE